MRTLTIVKNEKGEIKIAQFGQIVQYEENDESETIQIEKQINFFLDFVHNKEFLKKLENKFDKLKFFSEKELGEYLKIFFSSNSSKPKEYWMNYLDCEVGVNILDKIINYTGKDGVKLISYYQRVNDFMFTDVVFEINYATKKFKVRKSNGEIEGVIGDG